MMVTDTARVRRYAALAEELTALGEELGVVIHCQHEDIFNKMHRI